MPRGKVQPAPLVLSGLTIGKNRTKTPQSSFRCHPLMLKQVSPSSSFRKISHGSDCSLDDHFIGLFLYHAPMRTPNMGAHTQTHFLTNLLPTNIRSKGRVKIWLWKDPKINHIYYLSSQNLYSFCVLFISVLTSSKKLLKYKFTIDTLCDISYFHNQLKFFLYTLKYQVSLLQKISVK